MHAHTPGHPGTTVDQHIERIAALLEPTIGTLGTEAVPISEALGRITAFPVVSPVDLPLFRNSQMDGFAVHVSDLDTVPVTLPVVGEVAARPGTPVRLEEGTAVRIMTGAVVPDGANAVVPVEDTTRGHTPDGDTVTILRARGIGEFVRNRGSDAHAGDTLLPASQVLGSRHLAVIAAAGLDTVEVHRRLRVAVITTGAELIAPGEYAFPGQVYDANGIALAAAVTAAGGVLASTHRVVDDPEAMMVALQWAASAADVIVTSGGISMGDHEVVREVLIPLGASVGHIDMQPGGPQATCVFEGVAVVCFPGNPVSTQISFEIFLAPILREAAGLPAPLRARRALSSPVRSIPGKRQFLRGRVLPDAGVEVVSGPGSHLVAGLASADVLIDIPAHTTELNEGDLVETVPL